MWAANYDPSPARPVGEPPGMVAVSGQPRCSLGRRPLATFTDRFVSGAVSLLGRLPVAYNKHFSKLESAWKIIAEPRNSPSICSWMKPYSLVGIGEIVRLLVQLRQLSDCLRSARLSQESIGQSLTSECVHRDLLAMKPTSGNHRSTH